MVQSEDSSVKIVAFETIGYIGVSLEGKTALRELGNIMLDWLDKLGHGMVNKVFKNSALTTLTHLIRLEPENQVRSTNQRPVLRSRALSGPIRGHY